MTSNPGLVLTYFVFWALLLQALRPFEQQRNDDALLGTLTLAPGRVDPPTRIVSRYLLRDLPGQSAQNAQRGQAAYQVCTWSLADKSCASLNPLRGPPRCWKPCSSWYGYLAGVDTPD